MTMAELHGKIKPYEMLEDLLTSDVFCAFRYCDHNYGLIPFLEKAICFEDLERTPNFLNNVKSAHYYFWPKSKSLREPDLIIVIERTDGSTAAINIEAKYQSGKHNHETEEDTFELNHLSGDQLFAQYQLLEEKSYSGDLGKELAHAEEFYLFYITAHYVPPDNDIEETKGAANNHNKGSAIGSFFWLNWAAAWKICDDFKDERHRSYLILRDLFELLERKNLTELSLWKEDMNQTYRTIPWFWDESLSFWQDLPYASVDLGESIFWNIE